MGFSVFYCSNLRSLSENNNKTAMIAITIAATTDNTGIRLLDSPVTEAGSGVAVGAGKAEAPLRVQVQWRDRALELAWFVEWETIVMLAQMGNSRWLQLAKALMR